MLGRAAVDGNLWVHAAAIAWQILWITIMINLSVRLFRRGVLGDGDWKFWRKSKA
jgi:ABC-2 type transport system permease protein